MAVCGNIDHVVFDRAGVADSWRSRRWDSFTLNIPNSGHPGLCFIGLQLMHTRKSGLIFGVGEDAGHVAACSPSRRPAVS